MSLPDQGKASAFRGARIGSVFVVTSTGGGAQHYTALADGLAEVTALQADLLLGDPAINAANATPVQIPASEVALSKQNLLPPADDARPPDAPPTLVPPASAGGVLCAVYPDGGRLPALVAGVVTNRAWAAGGADRVVVPPGAGVLVTALGAPDAPTGTTLLVLEPGIAYPVPPAAVHLLGYDAADAVRMPSALVARLPIGPVLDPAAAGNPSGTVSPR
jgi:hypothetical protein